MNIMEEEIIRCIKILANGVNIYEFISMCLFQAKA